MADDGGVSGPWRAFAGQRRGQGVVFKRRDQRSWTRVAADAVWPRGGWLRALHYVKHRMRRLPGTPEQIARGIFAGAFTVFLPFFGLHFVVAAALAKLMRGSMIAAILATFLGNPLTYVPMAYISLWTGHFLLGTSPRDRFDDGPFDTFRGAAGDLWHNVRAVFTPDRANWTELHRFHDEVFLPWAVGGVIPGLILGTVCYHVSVPLIRAYQGRKAARLGTRTDKPRDRTDAAE